MGLNKGRPKKDVMGAKEQLLKAAELILRTDGWPAVTQSRVAKLAGYSPTLVFYYWKTMSALKEELEKRGGGTTVSHICRCGICLKALVVTACLSAPVSHVRVDHPLDAPTRRTTTVYCSKDNYFGCGDELAIVVGQDVEATPVP